MRRLSCILHFFIIIPLQAASLSTYTSTQTPIVNEAFDLFISSNKPFQNEPNTQALNKNFEIFGLSQSSQIKIINGKTQAEYQWILSLAAKKAGKVVIPALYVGKDRTHATSLNVIKTSTTTAKSQDTIELSTKATPKRIYSQQQVTYTVTLKISQSVAARLKNATLSLPSAENAIIKPLGSDKKYQRQVKNTTYTIIERRYAIFPQHSGKLIIKSPIFQGEVDTLHANSFSFPFGFSGQEIKKISTRDNFNDSTRSSKKTKVLGFLQNKSRFKAYGKKLRLNFK
ncbi:BatD family protein [Piscirickettsia litoralis]|uniref:Uncharacterized protein n=1 Tax=Piscirickettsia litoralis TaxID=1891921 RepID=A0ABX3A828_9GAMM|nr:BatD family protein [Piscirickettsia litoralis]ODN42269.1 hypothetical protein BGC07_04125 [Piscirickettsia litoralis]